MFEEPMKYIQCIAASALLMLSLSNSSAIAAADATGAAKVQLQVESKWELPARPLDIVYSLDGKKVFILTSKSQVLVYQSSGELLGTIGLSAGVSAIDIAPRGERLYLINEKDNSFTNIAVDFVVNVDTAGSPYLGNVDAPINLVVFTDFE